MPRPGFALALTLLVLVVVEATAVGVCFLALHELRTAAAAETAFGLRLAAENAARRAIAPWAPQLDRLAVGDTAAVGAAVWVDPADDGIHAQAIVERLGATLYFVRAEARRRGGAGGSARVGLLVRRVDLAAAAAALGAALTLGGGLTLDASASIHAGAVAGPGAALPDSAGCAAVDGAGVALVVRDADLLSGPDSARVEGAIRVDDALAHAPPAIAGLGVGELLALREQAAGPYEVVAPLASGGQCDTGVVGNWGAPGDPDHPCRDHFPLVGTPDGLLLHGAGQGILIVAGDLGLAAGARFDGIVLVTGRLAMDEDAVINGAVLLAGDGFLAGRIQYDPCIIHRALRHSRALAQPLRSGSRAWIPLF